MDIDMDMEDEGVFGNLTELQVIGLYLTTIGFGVAVSWLAIALLA